MSRMQRLFSGKTISRIFTGGLLFLSLAWSGPGGRTAAAAELEDGKGDAQIAITSWQGSPAKLSASEASGLRLSDSFPNLPVLLRRPGFQQVVTVNVCVSQAGAVSAVQIQGAVKPLQRALREAIASWRYRPLVQRGVPVPFCHDLQVTYSAS